MSRGSRVNTLPGTTGLDHDLDEFRHFRMLESVRKKAPVTMLHVVDKLCVQDTYTQGLSMLIAGTSLGHKHPRTKITNAVTDVTDIFRKRMKVG